MTQEYQDFLYKVEEIVSNQPIPPVYDPEEWDDKKFNCYAYAMRICMDLSGKKIRPGFISVREDIEYMCDKKHILHYFKKDCEALGLKIKPTTFKGRVKSNQYKIAVYCKKRKDFHFARQDENGKWSHKKSWKGKIRQLTNEDVLKNQDGYKLIGIFKVSKK